MMCATAAGLTPPSTTSTAVKAGGRAARISKPNLGGQIAPKRGYFPVPPTDTHAGCAQPRSSWPWKTAGVDVEVHHHEVATAGQAEIDMRFDTLVKMADNVMVYKYIVKNVARQNGLTATFMPKPLFGDNGSGMHVHQILVERQQQHLLR